MGNSCSSTKSVKASEPVQKKENAPIIENKSAAKIENDAVKIENNEDVDNTNYTDGWASSMERCICRRILAAKSTEEIEELRSRKTEFEWTLDKLTICGTKHGHRKAGVYCGDADTYSIFSDILDPLISEFHGITIGENEQQPETYEEAKIATLPYGVDILSTRIRCARSVAPYPMTVNMTKEQRIEFEAMMMEIFAEFEGDLAGTYYGHTNTDQERLNQLVEEHKLFCDDDECLRDGGCYDDWPHGRGIFMNEAETFMIWVGEEDHLRIMSMMKGSDVQKVYDMFYLGVETVDKALNARGKSFMFDPKYGYVNCCPSNLGTGMRASVHVNLPLYPTKADVADAITNSPMNGRIQARGTHGESKNTDGVTIYDISNYTRFGSCPSLIQEMIEGVIMLANVNTYTENWKSSYERCIVRRILATKTPAEIEELRSRETMHGWTLDKLTICGTKHGHRKAGVYCGDADTYTVFQDILDPLLSSFHGKNIGVDLQEPEAYETTTIDELPEEVDIISTRIRCARSVAPYPMTVNMTKEQRIEFEAMMMEIFTEFEGDLAGTYYGHTNTDPERLKQLIDEHKLFCDDDPCLKDGGCYDDWPHGRGIFMNEAETFMIWVGEEDHLRIMSMMKGNDVQKVWDMFYLGVQTVDEALQSRDKSFMFDPKYGYINCCPSNLGTGMRASVHVNLPNYTTKSAVTEAIMNSPLAGRIQARGTHGEAKNTDGVTIYDISNYTRFGTGPTLIKDMIQGVIMLSQ